MSGRCAYVNCGSPTGLTREGFCPTHTQHVASATTALDAEPKEED